MHRAPIFTILLLMSLSLSSTILSAKTASAAGAEAADPKEGVVAPSALEASIYGPILSEDPATRAQIKHLYLERNSVQAETLARLDELNRAYAAETDVDCRWDLADQMSQLKRDLEIRNIEIGLEIARLNGQEERAAEFALALDQILPPEIHFPAHRPDPALREARLREHGQK